MINMKSVTDICNNSYELLQIKGNADKTIAILNFYRNPDLHVEFVIIDERDIISKIFSRRLFEDKNKNQYFVIDSKKYYIKTKVR